MGYMLETKITTIFGKEGLIQKKDASKFSLSFGFAPTEFLFPPMHPCIAVPVATDNYNYLLPALLQFFMQMINILINLIQTIVGMLNKHGNNGFKRSFSTLHMC